MIPEWLMPVVEAGGTALVGAVATDAWQSARAGVGRLFRHAGPRRGDLAEQWADETAAAVEQAAEDERPAVLRVQAETWQRRLADLVQEYPEIADQLRAWEQDIRERVPAHQQTWVNTFIARDRATMFNAPGGRITSYSDHRSAS